MRFWIAIAVLSAIVRVQAALSDAPTYFSQVQNFEPVRRISLRAPSLDPASVDLHLVQRRRLEHQRLFRKRQQDGSLSTNDTRTSAENEDDVDQSIGFLSNAYYAPLNLSASAPQTVFVQLDTGSSDLWVVSTACTSAQCSTDRIFKFDQSQSQSFNYLQIGSNVNISSQESSAPQANVTVSAQGAQVTGGVSSGTSNTQWRRRLPAIQFTIDPSSYNASEAIPFSVVYDDGTAATGVLAEESIAFADLTSTGQVFGLVDSTNLTLAQQGISGVLGLGFPRGSAIARSLIGAMTTARPVPLLTSIFDSHNSSYPLFTLHLNSTGGSFTLGAADPNVLPTQQDRGLVEWHDVVPFPSGNTGRAANDTVNRDAQALDSYLYWVLELTAVGFDGEDVDLQPTYGEQVQNRSIALLDSGAPGLVGPPQQVDALFGQIDGARHVGSGRYVVPCTVEQRMFFSFGGRNYTLLPTDYIIGPAAGNSYLCLAWPAAAPGSTDGVDWVLGQPFMRAQYTLFSMGIADREAPKVGLYPLRAPADSSNPAQVFASQSAASVSAYVNSVEPIATTLPNSLVPVIYPTATAQYVFANATSTPSAGLFPSRVSTGLAIAPSTYRPILASTTGNLQLPVLVSTVEQLPVPSNPAQDQSDGASTSSPLRRLLLPLCTAAAILALCTM